MHCFLKYLINLVNLQMNIELYIILPRQYYESLKLNVIKIFYLKFFTANVY